MGHWLGENWFFLLGLLVMTPCAWYLGRPWRLGIPFAMAMFLVWGGQLLPSGWPTLVAGGLGAALIVVTAPLVAARWRRSRLES